MSWSNWWLAGTTAAIVALAAVSSIVALVAGRTAETLPENSPEGVVQRYLQALEDDDFRAAYSYLSSHLQQECSVQDFREGTRWSVQRGKRVILEGTEEIGRRTIVAVRISSISPDAPFAPSETSHRQEYTLEKQGGAWRFARLPWPLDYCRSNPTSEPL